MHVHVLGLEDSHQRRVAVTGLVDVQGELLPRIFVLGALGNHLLALNQVPLLMIKVAAEKNLPDVEKRDKHAAQQQRPKLKGSHKRERNSLYSVLATKVLDGKRAHGRYFLLIRRRPHHCPLRR